MRTNWLTLAAAACIFGCATFPDADSTARLAEQMVAEAHTLGGPALIRRTTQDARTASRPAAPIVVIPPGVNQQQVSALFAMSGTRMRESRRTQTTT